MGLKLIIPAASEPITLAEVKLQCNIDTTDYDTLITSVFIPAIRAKAENYTETAIIAQTWEQTLDAFPDQEIELLKPPVASITSVSYVDTLGVTQVLSSSLYSLDNSTYPNCWLLPKYNTAWPDTQASANAVAIRFVAGYASASVIPPDMRAWMLMHAATFNTQRETLSMNGRAAALPALFVDSLLNPYKIEKF